MLRRAVLISAAILVCGCQGMGQPGASPFGTTRIPPPGTSAYAQPAVTYPTGSNPAGMGGTAVPNLGAGQSTFGTGQPAFGTGLPTGPGQVAPGTGVPGFTAPGVNNNTGSGSFKSSSLFGSPPASQFPIPSGSPQNDAAAGASLFASRQNSLFGNNTGNTSVTPARFDGAPNTSAAPPVRFGDNRLPPAQSSIRLNGMPVNDATKAPTPRANTSIPGYPEITDSSRGAGAGLPAGYYPPQPPAGYAPNYQPYYAPGYPANNLANSLPNYVPGYAPGSTGTATNLGWKSKPDPVDAGETSLR